MIRHAPSIGIGIGLPLRSQGSAFRGLLNEYPGAAAAYSLRRLGSSGGAVVRVRRESDNGERDFNASGVSSGELVNWVNQQITPPLDLRELTATGRDGPIIEAAAAYSLRNLSDSYAGDVVEVRRNTDGALKDFKASEVTDGTLEAWVNTSFANALPLDTAGAAAAAYSLRNLSSSYAGSVVEVRRSSDGALRSFTAAEVTDGTLVAWVGAGNDGTVSKWYDQSGNDNHATQGTPASQPKIVSGGSLVTGGLAFDGANGGLRVAGPVLTSSSFFTTSVIRHDTGTSNTNSENVYGQYQSSTSGRWQLSANTSNAYSFFANAANNISSLSAGALGTSQTLISVNANGSNAEIFRDGTSKATDTYSGFTPATVDFTIGFDSINLREFNGKIQELIIYPTDQSDKRRAIEENIGSNYGITLTSSKDGTVSKWYDQSTTSGVPNANHAVQTDAAVQPKIVDAGSLVAGGLDFDGGAKHIDFTPFSATNETIFVQSSTRLSNAFSTIISGADNRAVISQTSSSVSYNVTAGAFASISAASVAGKQLFTFNRDGTNVNCYQNGSLLGSNTTYANSSIQRSVIGRRGNAEGHYVGSISEVIIYKSDQTDNRTALEANIGEVYGIAGIPAYDDTVNGFVETWYDQSGNGNNATQLTAGSQPKIVDAGVLVSGGIEFDGVDNRLTCPSLYSSDISIFNVVTTSNTVKTDNYMRMMHLCDGSDSFQLTRGGGNAGGFLGKLISKNTAFQSGTTSFLHGDINGENLISAVVSSTDTDAFVDGSLQSSSSLPIIGSGNSATTTIGARDDLLSSTFFAGSHAEIIIYNSDQSANRLAIEANINNQYDIY